MNRNGNKNVWNKNPQPQRQPKSPKGSPSHNPPPEIKFNESRKKLLAAAQKHEKDYESSSSEDELESDQLIAKVVEHYTDAGAENDKLFRTETFLRDTFAPGAAVCLICICKIKRDDETWNCDHCFCTFHLMCIQRWSKDSITQRKQDLEGQVLMREIVLLWGCPNCRHNYDKDDIPSKYLCFCKKTVNPKYQTLLVPHSCGEICRKDLVPKCGHQCLLLCHPGPCPPCPVTVKTDCHCGAEKSKLQRCSDKEWSCGKLCGKRLRCGKHLCGEKCHSGVCNECPKKSIQKCLCGSQQKLRDCASPIWQCEKVCNKLLPCGNHACTQACHLGECGDCELSKPRTCPCGKTFYHLPCTEDTPTCKDTCGKLLECGQHSCNLKCHKDRCSTCLETVNKFCRCRQHVKEVQCSKPYICETKCKNMRDCHRHPCNRKCCDGNCPMCEKPCGRSLSCGNHKCASVCHTGPCYPCNLTEIITCRCGETKIDVPCGRKYRVKPPKCNQLCQILPDCHHARRDTHRCHFGECPPCKQTCNIVHENCLHSCLASCHSSVYVKIEPKKATMPWEQTQPTFEKRNLPCPDCQIPVTMTCLGGHESLSMPCFKAKPQSCFRPCGRTLPCGNHICSLPCHVVESAEDEAKSGINCEECDNPCTKERTDGCRHTCPRPCHPEDCPPCKQMVRIRCHCGLTQPYIPCNEWTVQDRREELQSCGNQCPKYYDCGHRCRQNCHSGSCVNPQVCKKKVKCYCSCKRIKEEFSCDQVQKGLAVVVCNEACEKQKEEENLQLIAVKERKRKEDEIRNRKEYEKYQKMFEGKKRNKERRNHLVNEKKGYNLRQYSLIIFTGVVVIMTLFTVVYFV